MQVATPINPFSSCAKDRDARGLQGAQHGLQCRRRHACPWLVFRPRNTTSDLKCRRDKRAHVPLTPVMVRGSLGTTWIEMGGRVREHAFSRDSRTCTRRRKWQSWRPERSLVQFQAILGVVPCKILAVGTRAACSGRIPWPAVSLQALCKCTWLPPEDQGGCAGGSGLQRVGVAGCIDGEGTTLPCCPLFPSHRLSHTGATTHASESHFLLAHQVQGRPYSYRRRSTSSDR